MREADGNKKEQEMREEALNVWAEGWPRPSAALGCERRCARTQKLSTRLGG